MSVIKFDFKKKKYIKQCDKEHIIFNIIANKDYSEFIRYLSANNFNFDTTDYYGRTVLHYSIIKQKWKITHYLLLNKLVNIDARTITGATALDYAIALKSPLLITQLINFNCKYDKKLKATIGNLIGIDIK